MADPALIQCFENPNPARDSVIEHVAAEFPSVRPTTRHPDFGAVTLQYVPGQRVVRRK